MTSAPSGAELITEPPGGTVDSQGVYHSQEAPFGVAFPAGCQYQLTDSENSQVLFAGCEQMIVLIKYEHTTIGRDVTDEDLSGFVRRYLEGAGLDASTQPTPARVVGSDRGLRVPLELATGMRGVLRVGTRGRWVVAILVVALYVDTPASDVEAMAESLAFEPRQE